MNFVFPIEDLFIIIELVAIEVFLVNFSKSKYFSGLISGNLFCFDSDDIWEKEKLFNQLDFMIKNKYYFTYTNYISFNSETENNLYEIKPKKYYNFNKFTKDTSIATSTMMVKKSLIGTTKFSNTKICEDYFFKCQILKKVNYAYCLAENLMRYRIRKNSLQGNKIRNLYWIWYINKNHNKMNFIKNLLSIFSISFNSMKKYGFK